MKNYCLIHNIPTVGTKDLLSPRLSYIIENKKYLIKYTLSKNIYNNGERQIENPGKNIDIYFLFRTQGYSDIYQRFRDINIRELKNTEIFTSGIIPKKIRFLNMIFYLLIINPLFRYPLEISWYIMYEINKHSLKYKKEIRTLRVSIRELTRKRKDVQISIG